MILTSHQARAVYDAMCALNNVGGTLNVTLEYVDFLTFERVVQETDSGNIRAIRCRNGCAIMTERYIDQAHFAAAYGV